MTYLYVSSPLANLQRNIDEGTGILNNGDFKSFLFYCVVPVSFTLRLEESLNLSPPHCSLITPDLLAGTSLMLSYYTLGWLGMVIMIFLLIATILMSITLLQKFDIFKITTICILSTAVSLSIFANFFNRLDVILMIFVFPVLFHFVYNRHIFILHPKRVL
jgi:hypothetical protein